MADVYGPLAGQVLAVEVISQPFLRYRIVFDLGHGLEERRTQKQFT